MLERVNIAKGKKHHFILLWIGYETKQSMCSWTNERIQDSKEFDSSRKENRLLDILSPHEVLAHAPKESRVSH